jgi:hypothetical protein
MSFPCPNAFAIQLRYMRKIGLLIICVMMLGCLSASAGTYALTDGSKIQGEPIFPVTDNGVVFHLDSGEDTPRVAWDQLSQDSIRQLLAKATSPHDKAFIEPLVMQMPQERAAAQAQKREIVVKPIQPPPRPTTSIGFFAVFTSPVGLMILVILYATNLFAASEVAVYRKQPLATVCGLAAIPFLGVLSPIIFIAMPTRPVVIEGITQHSAEEAQTRFRATPPPTETTAPPPQDASSPEQMAAPAQAAAPVAATAPVLPEPIIFKRGEFSFNRRFFETKLAGFFRLVPSEAEKDMVIKILSSRGEFTGRRITKISPTELYLQIFHDNATADEMIPFTEVLEVQIRHKDTA